MAPFRCSPYQHGWSCFCSCSYAVQRIHEAFQAWYLCNQVSDTDGRCAWLSQHLAASVFTFRLALWDVGSVQESEFIHQGTLLKNIYTTMIAWFILLSWLCLLSPYTGTSSAHEFTLLRLYIVVSEWIDLSARWWSQATLHSGQDKMCQNSHYRMNGMYCES